MACPDRVVVSLVGDGGFGQNPAMLATAVESNIPVIWVIMNNCAFGTIAGCRRRTTAPPSARCSARTAQPSRPTLRPSPAPTAPRRSRHLSRRIQAGTWQKAMAANRPFVIDVAMQNAPVETAGHWNIMDIYSPGKKVHHADTSAIAAAGGNK
jgi:acetolactate synthase-1/2/3 large subunit